LCTLAEITDLSLLENLQKMTNTFTPKTIGEHLDLMTAKMLLQKDFKSNADISAPKLSASHIIDCVNKETTPIFKHCLKVDNLWSEINSMKQIKFTGLKSASKELFEQVIKVI
jgi:hypothetical protein